MVTCLFLLCGSRLLLLFSFCQGKQKQMHLVSFSLMNWTLLVGRELNLQCTLIQDRPLINSLLKWMGKYMDFEGTEGAWLTGILDMWVKFFFLTALKFCAVFCNAFKDMYLIYFYGSFLVLPMTAFVVLL